MGCNRPPFPEPERTCQHPSMTTADVRPATRPLTAADLDWVLDLIEPRRRQLAEQAPHFWNPAPGARALHGRFLGGQIADPHLVTLRTDHGFVFAGPRGDGFVIDDFLVDSDDRWPTDGAALVRDAVADRSVRIVCPVHELGRYRLAKDLGLTVAESWWTHDLVSGAAVEPDGAQFPSDRQLPGDGLISVEGTSGRLLPAPPVYAPGGPVLILSRIAAPESLAAAEQQAGAAGATVAVVPQRADDLSRAQLLSAAGYRRTTDYYDGVPVG